MTATSASPRRILVVNPASNPALTDRIAATLTPLTLAGGPVFDCRTLAEGPPVIKSQQHVDRLIPPLLDLIAAETGAKAAPKAGGLPPPAAVVIACFSDPGLMAAREIAGCPVLGIAESGVLLALTRGQSFGVISMAKATIPRHLRLYGAMGVLDRLADDQAVDLDPADMADTARTVTRMAEIGRRLRDDAGADVILLGCSGMAACRAPLEDVLGMPVVEPVQSAATLALGRVLLATA
jgi:allantoin racemase